MEEVLFTDVTLRDGLQDQPAVLPTESKRRIGELLVDAGFRSLEVTSFMRPDWVPQLADPEQLLAAFQPGQGVARRVLVPNRRGLERALGTGAEAVSFVASASSAHNLANLNRSTDQTLAEIPQLVAEARAGGRRVVGGVATAFGCPFAGEVGDGEVLRVVDAYLAAGVDEVDLADTMGMATRRAFEDRLRRVARHVGGAARLGVHLHDGGTGVGDLVRAALQEGVRRFDVAIGGIGGCPFAPGAPGNARAEELVPVVEAAGFSTGIAPARLVQAALALGLALGRAPRPPARGTGRPA